MESAQYPTTAYAKKLLYKYIPKNKADKSGLFLLPLQTGSGKTHATIEYIKEHIEKDSKSPIIYTVNTKHNLQDTYNKLLDALENEDKGKVLLLKSNFESIVDIFENYSDEIQAFKELIIISEFQSLQASVELIIKTMQFKNEELIKATVEAKNGALKREILKIYKSKSFKNEEQFLYEVNLLYPTINLHEYKAIFMTTHKLYYPMFGITGNYTIYTHKHFKNALLFFDEFDSQKSVLLNMIIKDKVQSSYEFLDLFKSIVSTFKTKQFYKKYKIDSETYYSVKKLCEEVYDKYFIQYGYQYTFENEIQNESILMNSTLSNVVHGQDKTTKINIEKNALTHINLIVEEGELSFTGLLRDVSRSLRTFIGMARSVVKAEVRFVIQQQKENSTPMYDKKTEYEITQRVVNDIIKEFGYTVEDRHYRYLKDVVLNGLFDKQKGFKSGRAELYEDGFKIINISQLDTDSKTNNFEFFELNDSPENFMKNLSNHLFVVGISATATVPTLMRNFDLDYLESKVNFITPNIEELEKMDKLYVEAKNQQDREIYIDYVEVQDNIVEIINKYFGGLESLYDDFVRMQKQDSYQFKRLIRLVYSYREFLLHDEIESFMCLLSALPTGDKALLNPNNIAELLYKMMDANYNSFKPEIQSWVDELKDMRIEVHGNFIDKLVSENRLFYIYNSDTDNKQKYEEMFKREIKHKSKVFIISSYQTIGVGANLEYVMNGKKKDYDAIYVDKPTSFTQREFKGDKQGNTKEKQVKAIFELESLFNKGYFSSSEYRRYVKDILKLQNKMKYLELDDSHNSIMSTIIQAIGRLYRTDSDTSKMFIYLHQDIIYSASNFDTTKQTLLPAVKQLVDYTKDLSFTNIKDREIEESINRFKERNKQTGQKINYMLKVFQGVNISSYTVKQWEETRKFLLSNPTVDTDAIEFDFCYSRMPTQYAKNHYYYYTQIEDYREVEIFFDDNFKKTIVSREAVMLDIISNMHELEECVKINNICLEFKHDSFMTPIAFNNLYKGALGEVIGKYLIEKYCSIELFSFNINSGDEYERFDYKLGDNSVYFDFKYYSQQTIEVQNQKELRDKAKYKLMDMQANKAVIINIFAEVPNGKSRKPSVYENIMIVPFLIDITKRESPMLDMQMMQAIKEFINDN